MYGMEYAGQPGKSFLTSSCSTLLTSNYINKYYIGASRRSGARIGHLHTIRSQEIGSNGGTKHTIPVNLACGPCPRREKAAGQGVGYVILYLHT